AAYQAASQTGGPNPSYIGSTGGGLNSLGMYAAPYQTPYAIQFNGGVQRELPKGIVLSVDFIHSATLKIPIQIDVNHVGAARFLNKAGAQAAIAATLAACGAASINAAIVPGGCPGGSGVDANGNPNASATIVDFASNGLDSGNQFDGSFPASSAHTAVSAFPGANPNVGRGFFILPVGRSGYDALQIVFKQQAKHPVPGVMSSNVQVSYSLSRIINPIQPGSNSAGSGDQFFSSYAWNNDNPNLFMGRSNLDHTNQLSFGGSMQLKYGLNASLVGHFYSAGATSLTLDSTSGAAGEIFRTDVDGDGTTGDLVPGTNPGAYMHEVKGAGLNKLINNYNATQAGTLTPAGKALVAAGLFTQSQLVSMNAVQQAIATAPTTPINNGVFRGFDASFTYPIKLSRVREGLSLEPGVALYNVSNMSNFGRLGGVLANTSTAGGSVGAVSNFLNGPNDTSIHDGIRWQRGSGTFDQGAPRSTEFQLKVNF
ncbi:MAG: TonB-dependent receptor, partial [Acidobacteriota bacterium]|nr:TonB-dependent receptor [Acidobacteriota bacterium]